MHSAAGKTGAYGFTVVTTKPRTLPATKLGATITGALDARGRVDRYRDGAPDILPDPRGHYVIEVASNGDLPDAYSFTLIRADSSLARS